MVHFSQHPMLGGGCVCHSSLLVILSVNLLLLLLAVCVPSMLIPPVSPGETPRRIIAKAVLTVTRGDIQDAAGSVQLCAGQIAGVEAAVHAVQECFQQDGTEAVLLVDASNAFNSLNRDAALHNIRSLCPSISTMLSTPTESQQSCSLMARLFSLEKGLHKEILWQCQCMLLQPYH